MQQNDPEGGIPERLNRGPRYRILFFFCCASILTSFNIAALTAVVPAISRSLNIPANDAAGIIPYYLIPYGLAALLYTPLTARFSVKSLMVASTLLYALGNGVCLWSDSLAVILSGRVLSGLAAAAVMPLGLMILGKIFEKEIRGRVLGLFFSSSFFGAMLGLILSGFAHWHWLFVVPAFLGFALAAGWSFCPHDGLEADRDLKVNYAEAFCITGLRRILVLIFVMSMLYSGVGKWYGVYLDRVYGYNQMTISALIILTAIACSVGQMIGGTITDKYGRIQACYAGIGITGLFITALIGKYHFWGIALILVLISVGWTIAHNGISTVMTDFPDRYRAELAGLNSCVRFLSSGLGFWLSGAFVEYNFGFTFFIIGVLMLSLIIFIHKIIPQSKSPLQIAGAAEVI